MRFTSVAPLVVLAHLSLLACAKPNAPPPRVQDSGAPVMAPGEERTTPRKALDVPAAFSAETKEAILTLGNAEHFGGSAVGYGGLPLPEVFALRKLLAGPNAPEALTVVLDQGTIAGQLMALSGLYFADHQAFERRAPAYATLDTPVSVRSDGCIHHDEMVPARTLVRAAGAVQYSGPDDNLEAMVTRNRIPPNTPIVEDILGGAYPFHLAGREHQTRRGAP